MLKAVTPHTRLTKHKPGIRAYLIACFRHVLETAPPELQRQVLTAYLDMPRTESDDKVARYEDAFFRARDLAL